MLPTQISVDALPGCKQKIGCGQRFVCGGLYWTLCHQIRPDAHIANYMLGRDLGAPGDHLGWPVE
jgi:hypothetical protein